MSIEEGIQKSFEVTPPQPATAKACAGDCECGQRKTVPMPATPPRVYVALHGAVSNGNLLVLPTPFFGQRASAWAKKQCGTTHRFWRAAIWFAELWPNVCMFMRLQLGGRVDLETYDARNAECENCPYRSVDLQTNRRGHVTGFRSFCDLCGCPRWFMSVLKRRNRLTKWECPKRVHSSGYKDDNVRSFLVRMGWVQQRQLDAQPGDGEKSSCSSCGSR